MGRSRQIARAVVLAPMRGPGRVAVGGANAALIKVGNLVLKADGGFFPNKLSRNSYEPIEFRGHANLINTEGGAPTALEELRLDFDRNAMLEIRGLPVCPLSKSTTPTPARRAGCARAL